MMKTNEAGEEYTQLAYETSKKRITLAGYRLANCISQIYNKTEKTNDIEQNDNENLKSRWN